jgi:polyisoprenoid-binding protein YceI
MAGASPADACEVAPCLLILLTMNHRRSAGLLQPLAAVRWGLMIIAAGALACAAGPRPQPAAPARPKDAAPDKLAAQRAASGDLHLADESDRWGIDAARERQAQGDPRKPAPPAAPLASAQGPVDLQASPAAPPLASPVTLRKPPSPRAPYRIDARKSRFIVETETSGLSSMFGHDHRIEVRDFSGAATFERGPGGAASLELTVQAGSLFLVAEANIAARQAVESALREEVLETVKYPLIVFKTRGVTSERRADGTYDVRLIGELRLHGVRRALTVPARVSIENGTLRAIGSLEIRQTDFKITPFSFVHGTVTIKDVVVISFDIVATQ